VKHRVSSRAPAAAVSIAAVIVWAAVAGAPARAIAGPPARVDAGDASPARSSADAGVDGSAPQAAPNAAMRPVPRVLPRLFLGAFPVEAGAPLFGSAEARVTLRFDPAQAHSSNELVRRLRIAIAADGSLALPKLAYPAASDKPARQHLRPSFVLDYDVAAFAPALGEARARLGASPSVADLVAFVDHYITHKGFGRGYDIASVVARRHEGDCTEHAVLLAALARAFRIPARVVEGVVLIEIDGNVLALGHAWVEVHRGGSWQPADAAIPGPERRVYLPLELLSDEGPGFAMSSVQTGAGIIGLRRVVLSPPPAR